MGDQVASTALETASVAMNNRQLLRDTQQHLRVVLESDRSVNIKTVVKGIPQGYCHVDEKLVDRPPRYWARARREPTMLRIRNDRQPQLDNTVQAAIASEDTHTVTSPRRTRA